MLFTKARAILQDETNWRKGMYVGRKPDSDTELCYCLVGALLSAHQDTNLPHITARTFADLDRKTSEFGWKIGDIINFNDDKHTTHKEVLEWLDEMVKVARE